MRPPAAPIPIVLTVLAILGLLLTGSGARAQTGPAGADGAGVPDLRDSAGIALTWLSITNWLVEAGDTRILLDGYLTRIDRRLVEADGSSHGPPVTDTAELRRLLSRALPDLRLDWILVGHGHWDHAFDVPAIARMTGARIAGSRTVCHQATALGVDPARCTAVEGGEELSLAGNVRARVIRWQHSGDPTTEAGRLLATPLELRSPPPVDPGTGGLRPGFLEDYPNGGGVRAYLLTIDEGDRESTLFWSNTGNPQAWDVAFPADTAVLRRAGVNLGNLEPAPFDIPTRDLLQAALREEGLLGVDAWIGAPTPAHVRQVVPVLRPRVFIPQHWDDFWTDMRHGVGTTFDASRIRPFLDSAGVRLVVPEMYYATLDGRRWAASGSSDEGRRDGAAASLERDRANNLLRFTAGLAGGLVLGATWPLALFASEAVIPLSGLGLVVLSSEAGSRVPPPDLAARARARGAEYAEGFAGGFADQRRGARRRAAWTGGGLGAAVATVWLITVLRSYP